MIQNMWIQGRWIQRATAGVLALNLIAVMFAVSTPLIAAEETKFNGATFTRLNARDQMMETGIKWKMTETLMADATAKRDQAQATFNPKFLLALRQYYSRINPIQYGGVEGQSINQIFFGTTAVEFNWTFMDPLAKGELIVAENSLRTTKEKTKQLQTDLAALTMLQFLNAQRLERQIELMNSNLNKSELIYKLAQARKGVGAGISLDISRARNLYELDRMKKIGTQNKRLKAEHELATTLGLEALPAPLEALEPKRIPIEPLDVYLEKALENRPDLKTAKADLATAQNARRYTEGHIFPKMSFIAELGTTQVSAFGMPIRTPTGFLGFALTIPIDSGGLIQAKKDEALSAERKANLQVSQIRLELLQQVKEASEQMQSADEALTAAENYVKTSQEEARIAEKRFENGASAILDYTTAHTSLASAQDTLTETAYNYEAAKLNYFRTAGDMDTYFRLLEKK